MSFLSTDLDGLRGLLSGIGSQRLMTVFCLYGLVTCSRLLALHVDVPSWAEGSSGRDRGGEGKKKTNSKIVAVAVVWDREGPDGNHASLWLISLLKF